MNRPELYKKTVDILYDAYFNDTLEHENCHACAVGNLVAANLGIAFEKGFIVNHVWSGDVWPEWQRIVWGGKNLKDFDESSIQISATGYTVGELRKIEISFEGANNELLPEDRMFNGLVAVLDQLAIIHEITDAEEINNDRFREHYNRKLAVAK